MKGDPRWITARFTGGECPKCHKNHHKGDSIYYYPIGKQAYCRDCGQDAHREFQGMCQDEHFYNTY